MPFDGLFINNLIKEVKILENKTVKNIIFNQDRYIFNFNFEKSLIINIEKSMSCFYLDDICKKIDSFNNNFLNHLRKLEQYKLKEISQYKTDRTVIFKFEKIDNILSKTEKYLILEAMQSYSNLILLDQDFKILQSYKPINLNHRNIKNNIFEFYNSNKLDFNELKIENIKNSEEISSNYLGLSKLISNYLFENKKNIKDLKYNPTIYNNDFYFSDIFYNDNDIQKLYFNNLSELLKYNFKKEENYKTHYEKILIEEIEKNKNKYLNILNNYELKKQDLLLKDKADFIYQNINNINLIKSNIDLDNNLTLSENAQKFYKEYKKAKASIEFIEKDLVEIQLLIKHLQDKKDELIYLESEDKDYFINELNQLGIIKKSVNKKIKREKLNILVFNINDNKIYVGKNSKQNEYILKNIAKHKDLWFHVKNHAGSHVILKGNTNDYNLIKTCSQLALYYSSQRFSNNVDIDYTTFNLVSRVRKMKAYNVVYKKAKQITQTVDINFIKDLEKYKELKDYE